MAIYIVLIKYITIIYNDVNVLGKLFIDWLNEFYNDLNLVILMYSGNLSSDWLNDYYYLYLVMLMLLVIYLVID